MACKERPQPPPGEPTTPPSKLEDAEGFYVPRTRIDLGTIDRDSIVAFSLDAPASIVKADHTGQEQVTHCRERLATPDTLHLSCIDPVLGTVTIDGHFLVPRVEDGVLGPTADDDLVDAMVAVTRKGKVRYAQRHRFRI
jgi:hypothetical protein